MTGAGPVQPAPPLSFRRHGRCRSCGEVYSSLGLTQAGFERLLATGPKTAVRWENGTVFQSATADKLMRLLAARPDLASLLQRGAGGSAASDPGENAIPRSPS